MKAMDVAGFNLSLAEVEVLRRVDASGRYARGIIPSNTTLLQSARLVEASAENYCPFSTIGQTFRGGKDKNVDTPILMAMMTETLARALNSMPSRVTGMLFEAFGLIDEAKRRPVELALTYNGAQLTNTISHVAAGL
jgi:hypothetical protein